MPQRPPWHAFRLGGVPLSWWAILSGIGTAAFVGLFLSSEDFNSVIFGIGGMFAGLVLLFHFYIIHFALKVVRPFNFNKN